MRRGSAERRPVSEFVKWRAETRNIGRKVLKNLKIDKLIGRLKRENHLNNEEIADNGTENGPY